MLTICGWCKKIMKEGNDKVPSHGICDDCLKEHHRSTWEKKQIKKGFKLVQEAKAILNSLEEG